MQITSVETIPVEVPVRTDESGYGIALYVGGNRHNDIPDSLMFEEALAENTEATMFGKKLLVRLETDESVTGWSEMKVPTMRLGRVLNEDLFEPELVGRSVSDIEPLVDKFTTFSTIYYTDITPT